jgi:Amt family ammonium transporter
MKYSAIMAFIAVWMFVVYFPLAHMVWGIDGFMNGVWNAKASIKAIDFAGGTVVHMSSGWSALVLCLILGKRTGWGKRAFLPHSLTLTMVGTGMLWVGWYGFNAGSAVAADGIAANAFMTTTLAAAIAGATWPAIEWLTRGKPTILGFCSGIVAGLVVITPAAGFVNATGAVIIGVLAGVVPYLGLHEAQVDLQVRRRARHLRRPRRGRHDGRARDGHLRDARREREPRDQPQGHRRPHAVGRAAQGHRRDARARVVGTTVIAYALKAVMGLRPSVEQEEAGLDETDHGEAAYHPEEGGFHGTRRPRPPSRARLSSRRPRNSSPARETGESS